MENNFYLSCLLPTNLVWKWKQSVWHWKQELEIWVSFNKNNYKKPTLAIFDQNATILLELLKPKVLKIFGCFFIQKILDSVQWMKANCISKSFVSLPVQDLFRMGPPLAGSWGVSLLADLTITVVRVQIL